MPDFLTSILAIMLIGVAVIAVAIAVASSLVAAEADRRAERMYDDMQQRAGGTKPETALEKEEEKNHGKDTWAH